MGGGKKGGSSLKDPWASEENKAMAGMARNPLMGAGNTDVTGIGKDLAAGNQWQNQAGTSLNSMVAGADGMMKGIGGSEDLLSSTIGGNFLDVANNPIYAARNTAIGNEANRNLMGNLDMIDASAQRATGGVGAGSAGLQQRQRAIQTTAQGVGDTIAQMSAQDLARERGLQQEAMNTGMNIPLQRYQQQLGASTALGDFGGNMAMQQFKGNMLPYDLLMQYLGLAKGTAVQNPNMWQNISGMMQGISSFGGGGGSGFMGMKP